MNLDVVLADLARDPHADYDVAEVALHLAQEEYPRVDVAAYLGLLKGLARDARPYLAGDLRERCHGLCRYLFHEVGFHGNAKEYYDPRNSYLTDVLDRLTGIPITLSLITIAVGRRVDLPFFGVGLPGHFIVQCDAADSPAEPLFFDPFHGGRELSIDQCHSLVTRVTGSPLTVSPVDLGCVAPGHFLQRMLNNLRGIYLKAEDFPRAARILTRLHQLAPDDAQTRRDLGVTLLAVNRPGPALDHLNAYLAAAPDASDAESVAVLARTARRDLGRWN